MVEAEGARLAAEYDGKEPASLAFFLETIGFTRKEFYEIAVSHTVDPWKFDGTNIEVGKELRDQKDWV